ncbi:transcriptional regulator [Novosphingobium indicum]|uniref:Transcriptional regulator n=1 Tax=Novosphingobium indicum TaxID=462949 RepID=A0ABQ2JST1_9SPHN|nr:Rrf2 family transcriptional regulator [Novosphingobium indicum]GGN54077.1 transcriptional regulator [Novosphingobium indicum]
MAHLTASVEYGLHCLLSLVDGEQPRSARDLALFQGISPSFVAKIFAKLEKAGVVEAAEGVRGGYRLARAPERITVLELVDAIEGRKPLFDCQEIRSRCALFEEGAPTWATRGVCSIHAVMLKAEKAMREVLASETLADIGGRLDRKAPAEFGEDTKAWFDRRIAERGSVRLAQAKDLMS